MANTNEFTVIVDCPYCHRHIENDVGIVFGHIVWCCFDKTQTLPDMIILNRLTFLTGRA